MSFSKYFKEFDGNPTLEEKTAIVRANIEKAKLLRKEISDLTSQANEPVKESKNNRDDNKGDFVSSVISSIDENNDPECEELYNKINLLSLENISEEEQESLIRKILGSNLSPLRINRIKLMLYKDCIDYSKTILESRGSDDAMIFYRELKSTTNKIAILDDILEIGEEVEIEELSEEDQINSIFFLMSDNANIIALENLRRNVPKEYYPAFKRLIMNLKEGKITRFKRLKRYNYYELKNFKIRIIFDRLSRGNYVIIDCFMKKVNTGVAYRSNLENRATQYLRKRDFYVRNFQDKRFIREHESYFEDVINLLEGQSLESEVQNGLKHI